MVTLVLVQQDKVNSLIFNISGKEAAMACTVAVEDTIVTHYTDQIREIVEQGKEEEYRDLLQVIFSVSFPIHK